MTAPKDDLRFQISCIPDHVGDLAPEAISPIDHFKKSIFDSWTLLQYFDQTATSTNTHRASFEHHRTRLRSMVFLELVEAFERFLKELASTCVSHVGALVLDDRLSVFAPHSRAIAAHFSERDLGKALTEGETWLDSDAITRRFRRLLADPFEDGSFSFFPNRKRDPDFWRRETMDILWQLRHSITHNVGVITRSDAAKLRLLRRKPVDAPKLLCLTNNDVLYTKLFLDDLAAWSNGRVAKRLAELLTTIHEDNPTLFDPAERAAELAESMRVTVTVAGATATP